MKKSLLCLRNLKFTTSHQEMDFNLHSLKMKMCVNYELFVNIAGKTDQDAPVKLS